VHCKKRYPAGLPDGILSNQKSQFGLILEGLAIEDVGIFYGYLVNFPHFGMLHHYKSGNPVPQLRFRLFFKFGGKSFRKS
jgi:hypothetical protein